MEMRLKKIFLFEYELHKKILCKRGIKCSYCIYFRRIKKYKCIAKNMHFKYSYRICMILIINIFYEIINMCIL